MKTYWSSVGIVRIKINPFDKTQKLLIYRRETFTAMLLKL